MIIHDMTYDYELTNKWDNVMFNDDRPMFKNETKKSIK